ncbi:MAG: hypothetical protein II532_02235 [Bacteroidales bacterium]|nr:hypothetical protein [Bacteroidales bacterium]
MTDNYDDIIHLPHPTSKRHPQMPLLDRAAQFAPFAALNGHGAAIKETARRTDSRVELTESSRSEMDQLLQQILSREGEHPTLSLVYFRPDERKAGGSYQVKSGTIKHIDRIQQQFVFTDGTVIPFAEVIGI